MRMTDRIRNILRCGGAVKRVSLLLAATLSLGVVTAPAALASNAKTIQFNILGISGWVPSELAGRMAPQFEAYAKKHYGQNIKISFSGAPFAALEQKAATSLAAHSGQYDLIISDSQWLGSFATPGWIQKLNGVIKSNHDLNRAEKQFPKSVVWSYQTYPYKSANLYGFPQEGDVLVLYVRKDMLNNPKNQAAFKKKYGWALPTTFKAWENISWKQFSQIAAFFNHPKKGFYGFAGEYAKTYDFISDHVMSMMWTWGGHIWNRKTRQVYGILNSKTNDRALSYYIHLLKYQPPGANTYGINGVIQALTQGKVFSGLTWSAVGPAILTKSMKSKFMVVPPPGRRVHGKVVRIYCLGGQPWVINKFIDAQHHKVAIEFLKWWYLPSTQERFAKLGGNPVISSVLNKQGFDKIHPWYRAYKYMLSTARSDDFWHVPTYADMLEAQQEAWTALATGEIHSAKLANEYAACQQQNILYSAGLSDKQPPSSCMTVHLH